MQTESKHTLTFSNVFFSPENRVVYEIMWKDIVEAGMPQMKLWRMRIARYVVKAAKTYSQNI
jgi:hypothetical protein